MVKDLTTVDDDIGIELSDIMLVFMMVIVGSLMTTVVTPVAQQLQAQAYTGMTDERRLNCTPTMQWLNLISGPPYVGWISATFYNDGPDSAFIGVNNPNELVELMADPNAEREGYQVSMVGASRRIEFVFYRSNLGERASVRGVGKY